MSKPTRLMRFALYAILPFLILIALPETALSAGTRPYADSTIEPTLKDPLIMAPPDSGYEQYPISHFTWDADGFWGRYDPIYHLARTLFEILVFVSRLGIFILDLGFFPSYYIQPFEALSNAIADNTLLDFVLPLVVFVAAFVTLRDFWLKEYQRTIQRWLFVAVVLSAYVIFRGLGGTTEYVRLTANAFDMLSKGIAGAILLNYDLDGENTSIPDEVLHEMSETGRSIYIVNHIVNKSLWETLVVVPWELGETGKIKATIKDAGRVRSITGIGATYWRNALLQYPVLNDKRNELSGILNSPEYPDAQTAFKSSNRFMIALFNFFSAGSSFLFTVIVGGLLFFSYLMFLLSVLAGTVILPLSLLPWTYSEQMFRWWVKTLAGSLVYRVALSAYVGFVFLAQQVISKGISNGGGLTFLLLHWIVFILALLVLYYLHKRMQPTRLVANWNDHMLRRIWKRPGRSGRSSDDRPPRDNDRNNGGGGGVGGGGDDNNDWNNHNRRTNPDRVRTFVASRIAQGTAKKAATLAGGAGAAVALKNERVRRALEKGVEAAVIELTTGRAPLIGGKKRPEKDSGPEMPERKTDHQKPALEVSAQDRREPSREAIAQDLERKAARILKEDARRMEEGNRRMDSDRDWNAALPELERESTRIAGEERLADQTDTPAELERYFGEDAGVQKTEYDRVEPLASENAGDDFTPWLRGGDEAGVSAKPDDGQPEPENARETTDSVRASALRRSKVSAASIDDSSPATRIDADTMTHSEMPDRTAETTQPEFSKREGPAESTPEQEHEKRERAVIQVTSLDREMAPKTPEPEAAPAPESTPAETKSNSGDPTGVLGNSTEPEPETKPEQQKKSREEYPETKKQKKNPAPKLRNRPKTESDDRPSATRRIDPDRDILR